ncbi:hypothetical protein [Bailinhaonella thermotolerans]|uniref:Uncharacterized protein n=1 Tax=Bailinhaonella thermotolerans TaxID=1070861 RepID=A0A3A4A1D0_9ACTN|nr:hypothetical protein [Bailinhaonella thermotolerans]RJL21062.1 hypothetical protein D5H75_38255 [Bailinhaonella thermotolerans]
MTEGPPPPGRPDLHHSFALDEAVRQLIDDVAAVFQSGHLSVAPSRALTERFGRLRGDVRDLPYQTLDVLAGHILATDPPAHQLEEGTVGVCCACILARTRLPSHEVAAWLLPHGALIAACLDLHHLARLRGESVPDELAALAAGDERFVQVLLPLLTVVAAYARHSDAARAPASGHPDQRWSEHAPLIAAVTFAEDLVAQLRTTPRAAPWHDSDDAAMRTATAVLHEHGIGALTFGIWHLAGWVSERAAPEHRRRDGRPDLRALTPVTPRCCAACARALRRAEAFLAGDQAAIPTPATYVLLAQAASAIPLPEEPSP